MMDLPALEVMAAEMRKLAADKPFRMSAYTPYASEEMCRKIEIDGKPVNILFTLDEYLMMPHRLWHLTVSGDVTIEKLAEIVFAFFQGGKGAYQVPKDALAKLGMPVEALKTQWQFCQIIG